jgi:hypothetical protein
MGFVWNQVDSSMANPSPDSDEMGVRFRETTDRRRNDIPFRSP